MNATTQAQYVLMTPQTGDFRSLREIVNSTLTEQGFQPVLDEVEPGTTWEDTIQQAIERSDFVIADLTGGNPNVMYEVGFAQALRKPVLFMVQEGSTDIPRDIRGNLFVVYDPAKPSELREKVLRWMPFFTPDGSRINEEQ